MENSLSTVGNKAKGLFDQKGGTFGMVLLAIGVLFFIIKLPAIVSFVDSLFHLVITLAALATILFVLTDKKTRMLVGTLYMMGVRSLIGAVIKINPIAILEDTITRMYKSIENVEDKMGKLNGIRLKLKDKIKQKKKLLSECLDRLEVAKRTGKNDQVILEDRQSVRLTELTQDYIDLQTSTENWYNTLSKIADKAKLTVQDAQNEVDAQKEKYEMVKTSHSAFKSAMSILQGDPDQLAMFNQAFQYVNDDIMDKIGEMDRVMNSTGGMLDKIDLEKESYMIKGNDISEKYKELGIDALFTKFDALPSHQMTSIMTNTPEATVISSTPLKTDGKSKYFDN